jgi:hypothetical protein
MAGTRIDWNDLAPTSLGDLFDGDIISLETDAATGSDCTIVLNSMPALRGWWKAIKLFDAAGNQRGPDIAVQDSNTSAEQALIPSGLGLISRIELWKAKEFGIHKPMYFLDNVAAHLAPSTQVTFTWRQDSGHQRDAQFNKASWSGVQSFNNNNQTVNVAAGSQFTLQTRVVNNSTIDFDPALGFKVGSQDPQDNTTWGAGRWALPAIVNRDDGLDFNLTFTAPNTPGAFTLSLKMLQEGVEWFGQKLTFQVTVGGATGGGGGGGSGSTCVVSALVALTAFAASGENEILNPLRTLRADLLQSSPAAAHLVNTYNDPAVRREVRAIIAASPEIQRRCLQLVLAATAFARESERADRISSIVDDKSRKGAAEVVGLALEVLPVVTSRCTPEVASRLSTAQTSLRRLAEEWDIG